MRAASGEQPPDPDPACLCTARWACPEAAAGGYLLQVVVWGARGLVCPVRLIRDGRTVRFQGSLFVVSKEGLHDNRLLTKRDGVLIQSQTSCLGAPKRTRASILDQPRPALLGPPNLGPRGPPSGLADSRVGHGPPSGLSRGQTSPYLCLRSL